MKVCLRPLLFTLLALFLVSCASTPKKETGLKPADFAKDQDVRWAKMARVGAKMSVHIESGGESVTGRGLLAVELPDKMRLEVRDPVGKLHYMATLFRNEFLAQYVTQGKAYADKESGSQYFKKVFGVLVSGMEFHRLILGVIPARLIESEIRNWRWDEVHGYYRADCTVWGMKYQIAVDGEFNTLREIAFEDKKGEKVRISYADLRPCCGKGNTEGFNLARSVKLSHPKSKSVIEITFNDLYVLKKGLEQKAYQPSVTPGLHLITLPEN